MSRTVRRVDCQSHLFPRAYAEVLTRSDTWIRVTGDGDEYQLRYGDAQQFRLRLEEYAADRKLRAMDAARVDVSVISVNIPGPDQLAPELAVEAARVANDELAAVRARHPDRFVGLAGLPLADVPAALAELERATGTLGLRGVLMGSSLYGHAVDAPELEPFYARIAAKRIPLVLHPVVAPWHETIRAHSMIPMIGFMVDTAVAMLRLILGGVLERHPELIVVHPHVGGVLPYVMGRVEEQTEVKRRGRDHISRPPGDYYRNVYLDTATPSPASLRYAYEAAGPDRLLLGSDHPWIEIGGAVELVEGMAIPAEEKAKILGGNACGIFRIG